MALRGDVQLGSHQERARAKAVENDGQILLTHEMGTGKTLSSVAIVEELRKHKKSNVALAVVPAGLRYNYAENGVKKFTDQDVTIFGTSGESHPHVDHPDIPKTPYYIVSYDMFKKDPDKYLEKTKADTLVVDEMHNFRNQDTINHKQMRAIRSKVKNFIGLTGTPLNNDPYDVVPLIDIVSNGAHKLGTNRKQFGARFVREMTDRRGNKHRTIVNRDLLKNELQKYVHHATQQDLDRDMAPKKHTEFVDVEMSPLQIQQYKFVMGQLPEYIREKVRKGMPVERKEATWILPKLIQARNVMNGIHYLNKNIPLSHSAMLTPKIKKALDDIDTHMQTTSDAQVIVHSHMLEGGVDVMAQGLKDRGIPVATYTGRENADVRNQVVKDYNARKIRALVVSSAGGTGLNLPDTTMHVALDGHYNPAVIDQIEARGVRAGGQKHRLPQQRHVIVKRYRSVFPDTWLSKWGLTPRDTSVDEWVYSLAGNKNDLNSQVEALLSKAASLTPYSDVFYEALRKLLSEKSAAITAFAAKTAGIAAYHYSKKGKEPGNMLDADEKTQEKILKQMERDGFERGEAEAYVDKREKIEKLLRRFAKKLLGDKVDLKHPLYFRIGKDKKLWGSKDSFKEYKLDPALLECSTFSAGDSFDYYRQNFGSDERLKKLIEDGQMELERLEKLLAKGKKPEMLDRKDGNYVEGQLWADYEVKGDKIVPAKGD